MKRILLCVDGEPHTERALAQALLLAARLDASITALFVVDPWLEKFTNEIYAVNRDECRAHLERSLREEGEAALAAFLDRARSAGVAAQPLVDAGDRAEVIAGHAPAYDLVIIGGKVLEGWYRRFESRNLPEQLFRRLAVPLLTVR